MTGRSHRVALNEVLETLNGAWGVRSESLHLTLAFLGDTPVPRWDTLRKAADTLTGASFTLKLNRPG